MIIHQSVYNTKLLSGVLRNYKIRKVHTGQIWTIAAVYAWQLDSQILTVKHRPNLLCVFTKVYKNPWYAPAIRFHCSGLRLLSNEKHPHFSLLIKIHLKYEKKKVKKKKQKKKLCDIQSTKLKLFCCSLKQCWAADVGLWTFSGNLLQRRWALTHSPSPKLSAFYRSHQEENALQEHVCKFVHPSESLPRCSLTPHYSTGEQRTVGKTNRWNEHCMQASVGRETCLKWFESTIICNFFFIYKPQKLST